MDTNFPKKSEEENKIPIDVINDDQALAAQFNKMTDAEEALPNNEVEVPKEKKKFNKFNRKCF